MKKLIALLLALLMVMTFAACTDAKEEKDSSKDEAAATEPQETEPTEAEPVEEVEPTVTVMTYAEFLAAETDAAVVIESYVQGNQAWWFDSDAGHGKVTVYLQDAEGAYFAYEVNMTEEDAAKLVPGTKVRVTGDKAEWAGELEIMNGTIEFLEGDTFIAEAKDVSALLGTEELSADMNKLVTVKGMTVKSLSYKDSEWDPDIYVTLTLNGADYDFCVENYLTGPDTDLYKAVAALKAGDVVDITGFLYWYEGPNTHITAVEVAQ